MRIDWRIIRCNENFISRERFDVRKRGITMVRLIFLPSYDLRNDGLFPVFTTFFKAIIV